MTSRPIKSEKTKSERRMGPAGSDNWHAMLDGAEDILREEGHAALTSRRIAERIGVKQRLIYYYFLTMDDLIVATFHRLSERGLEQLRASAGTEGGLREIWDANVRSTDARLISEFMALANRIDGLRSEVIRFIEEARRIQIGTIEAALKRNPAASRIPVPGLALLATSLALSLSREQQLGVTLGHAEINAVIERFFGELQR